MRSLFPILLVRLLVVLHLLQLCTIVSSCIDDLAYISSHTRNTDLLLFTNQRWSLTHFTALVVVTACGIVTLGCIGGLAVME